MKTLVLFLIPSLLFLISCEQQLESRLGTYLNEKGPREISGEYLGQKLPDSIPLLFAPKIVSTGLTNRDITFSPNGDEMFFTFATSNYSFATLLNTRINNGVWSVPQVASFAVNPEYASIEPCFSYDGNMLFFASDRPINDSTKKADENIWVVKRKGNDWGEPLLLDYSINTSQGEFYPTVTKNGTLYFTRDEPSGIHYIFRSAYVNGEYTEPEKLPEQVNCGRNRFNAYISPDESFIIIPATGVEKGVTGVNYYISFRSVRDEWSDPINMGKKMNKNLGRGWSASLSHDGKYLFFMSSKGISAEDQPVHLNYDFLQKIQSSPQNGNADIYWVKSDFIEKLRVKSPKQK